MWHHCEKPTSFGASYTRLRVPHPHRPSSCLHEKLYSSEPHPHSYKRNGQTMESSLHNRRQDSTAAGLWGWSFNRIQLCKGNGTKRCNIRRKWRALRSLYRSRMEYSWMLFAMPWRSKCGKTVFPDSCQGAPSSHPCRCYSCSGIRF